MSCRRYDALTTLGISKWLHFKSGDEGLKRFFCQAHDTLRSGGFFVLKPQPLKRYKIARKNGAV